MSEQAFFDDLEQQIPHLRRYARALTREAEAADDLVQDTLVRAISRRERFREGSNLRAWTTSLMHNLFIDHCRRSQVRGIHVAYDDERDGLAGSPSEPSQRWAVAVSEFWEQYPALRDNERQVIMLVGIEGWRYREVAEELGLAQGTVKSRLSRARARLREAG